MNRMFAAARMCFFLGGFLLLALTHRTYAQQPEPISSLAPQVQEVIQLGKALESRALWGESLKLYEETLRLYPEVRELQQRYNYARLHRDIFRRYADAGFREMSLELTEADLADLVRDVLVKFDIYYVAQLSARQIFVREINGLEIALEDEIFRAAVLPGVGNEKISAFRQDVRNLLTERDLQGTREVYEATMEIGSLSRKHFPDAPAPAVVLECICGLVNTLDPHSTVLTGTQLQDVLSSIRGNFVGLGVEIRLEGESILIQRVMAESPADLAGVRKGDVILAVDGHDLTKEASADRAAGFLLGDEGSDVNIVLQTSGEMRRDVMLRREKIVIPALENAHIVPDSDGVAYIRIPTFQDESAKTLNESLWDLYHQGMKSLVLDLRGNPGGLLLAAVEMADLFVPEGVIVSTYGKNDRQKQCFTARKEGTWRVPLVVLIDNESASASEIFAGAIRDNHRGYVVGERSFGKGSVQGVFHLSGKKLGVKLTTSLFYSPSGQKYNHVGVTPDLVVHHVAKPVLTEVEPRVGGKTELPETEKMDVITAAEQIFRSQNPAGTEEIAPEAESDLALEVAIRVLSRKK